MEALSDGVFGFAATLLVLDIALHPPGTPLGGHSKPAAYRVPFWRHLFSNVLTDPESANCASGTGQQKSPA